MNLGQPSLLAIVTAILATSGCSNEMTQPEESALPPVQALSTSDPGITNTGLHPLSVSFTYGWNKAVNPGPYGYAISVGGSNGPFYVRWFATPCYLDGRPGYPPYCGGPSLFAQGQDLFSVEFNMYAEFYSVVISAQVRQVDNVHFSGMNKWKTIGPAASGQFASFADMCSPIGYYPFDEHRRNAQGDWAYFNSYMRGCNGERVYADTGYCPPSSCPGRPSAPVSARSVSGVVVGSSGRNNGSPDLLESGLMPARLRRVGSDPHDPRPPDPVSALRS